MSEILASNPGIDCNFVAAVLVAWTKPHCVTYKEHLHKFQFISNLALFASALRCFAACFAFSSSVSSFFWFLFFFCFFFLVFLDFFLSVFVLFFLFFLSFFSPPLAAGSSFVSLFFESFLDFLA